MKRIDSSELARGIEVEMEHTASPVIAKAIALDHLREDPHYYTKLAKCFPREHAKRNPIVGMPPRKQVLEHYERFHGVPPDRIDELDGVWYPGELVLIGHGVDIGYGNDRQDTEKRGWFVHDFNSGVKIYRRAKPGENWNRSWHNFSADALIVLGYNIGFSYKDSSGAIREVRGSRRKKLCVTPDKKTLVIVGSTGVEFLATGGKMYVEDWIYE